LKESLKKENMITLKGKTVIPYSRFIALKDVNIIPGGNTDDGKRKCHRQRICSINMG